MRVEVMVPREVGVRSVSANEMAWLWRGVARAGLGPNSRSKRPPAVRFWARMAKGSPF